MNIDNELNDLWNEAKASEDVAANESTDAERRYWEGRAVGIREAVITLRRAIAEASEATGETS